MIAGPIAMFHFAEIIAAGPASYLVGYSLD
jgi:hypothetical protein